MTRSRIIIMTCLLLLGGAVAGAIWRRASSSVRSFEGDARLSSAERSATPPELPTVILLVIDTLRADHTDPYGYERPTVGKLGDLLSRATRYENAYAPAGWTVPSTASILTGLGPLRHGTRTTEARLRDDLITLTEVLHDAGLRTAAFSHNVHISPGGGFAQGFEHFTAHEGSAKAYPDAETLIDPAVAWLSEEPGWPAFLYLQPMNCHGPYRVPWRYRDDLLGEAPDDSFEYHNEIMKQIMFKRRLERRSEITPANISSLRDQYDTAIRYTMDRMAELFEALPAETVDEALVIVVSDHGEELFEHQGFSHAYSIYEEVVRVPLWVKLPGQRAPAVVEDPVSLMDIYPTVLQALGLSVKHPLDGTPLPRRSGEGSAERPLVFDTAWPGRAIARGLRVGRYKVIHIDDDYAGRKDITMLFDIVADPAETRDLASELGDRARDMMAQLDALTAHQKSDAVDAPPREAMDEEVLRALGYVQ